MAYTELSGVPVWSRIRDDIISTIEAMASPSYATVPNRVIYQQTDPWTFDLSDLPIVLVSTIRRSPHEERNFIVEFEGYFTIRLVLACPDDVIEAEDLMDTFIADVGHALDADPQRGTHSGNPNALITERNGEAESFEFGISSPMHVADVPYLVRFRHLRSDPTIAR